MIQFTENPLQAISMNKTRAVNRGGQWPGLPLPKPLSGHSSSSFGDASSMENLLVHFANAIESNDATLAQQILWVLNNTAPPDGDSNQRLTSAFLRALVARAASSNSPTLAAAFAPAGDLLLAGKTHMFSVTELACFVDLTPWHRFGFTAANSAIVEAVEGYSTVHIVDLSLTHCMQIPTLIDAMANRLENPPHVKLTVAAPGADPAEPPPPPPLLDLSYEELGSKLVNFAMTRNILLDFHIVRSTFSDGFASLIQRLRFNRQVAEAFGEALVVNCHMMLHYISEEPPTLAAAPDNSTSAGSNLKSLRSMFLREIRSLNPKLMILVDEDADFTSNNPICRLRCAFNYLWIHYDAVDTFLAKGSEKREWYEADVRWKIENVVAQEGERRVERSETKERWKKRMREVGFQGVGFGEDGVAEVKVVLEEYAAGWGCKRDEEGTLVLTWKGHSVVFASAWVCV